MLYGTMGFRALDVGQSDVRDPWVIGCEDLGCNEQGSLTENGKESIAWRQGSWRVSERQRRGRCGLRSRAVEG